MLARSMDHLTMTLAPFTHLKRKRHTLQALLGPARLPSFWEAEFQVFHHCQGSGVLHQQRCHLACLLPLCGSCSWCPPIVSCTAGVSTGTQQGICWYTYPFLTRPQPNSGCTVLYCAVLYHTAVDHTVLYHTVLYFTVVDLTVMYCLVLFCTALHRT